MRASNRKNNQLRPVIIEPNVLLNADGSCMIKFGHTHVICSASIDESLPPFLRNKNNGGWVTAEYGMLPRSTVQRMKRESSQGKQSGRTQEIQRLIGRSMRAAIDLKILGERQILIDCDVINADGGTRTAAITGSYVAMHLAISKLLKKRILKTNPLTSQIAAISCGIYNGVELIDLNFSEDSEAEVDANFVFSSNGGIVEVQSTAEKKSFTEEQFTNMLKLAQKAAGELFAMQAKSLLVI